MAATACASPDAPHARPRYFERVVLYAFLRMMGHTQKHAAHAVQRSERRAQEWEENRVLYGEARAEARKRWLDEAVDAARKTLLESIRGGAGDLALKLLERVDPTLAPPTQRLKHEGQVDLVAHPAWITLRVQILEVLAAYPEARALLAEVLTHGDNNGRGPRD